MMRDNLGPAISVLLLLILCFIFLNFAVSNIGNGEGIINWFGRFMDKSLETGEYTEPKSVPETLKTLSDELPEELSADKVEESLKDYGNSVKPLITAVPYSDGQTDNAQTQYYECVSEGTAEYAELVYVIDGDTIVVKMEDGSQKKVRYIGVNTTEIGTPYSEEGTEKNTELVNSNGGHLSLFKDKSETDKYGRLLRYVFAGDMFVNYELVKSGLAEAVEYKPDTSCKSLFHSVENFVAEN